MTHPVVIVGGGLAGLACALTLQENGVPFVLLEASDRVGGRLKTDKVGGYRLDRGFQVYFEAYPNASGLLDHDRLRLRRFRSGALIRWGDRLDLIDAASPVATLRSRVFGLQDKIRFLSLGLEVRGSDVDHLRQGSDVTIEEALRRRGLSPSFIDRFARPFFGGIFLDRSLRTSSRQFLFVAKMLSEGPASIPAVGIEEIPRQLARRLPMGSVRTYAPVERLIRDSAGDVTGVELSSHERIAAEHVVLATDAKTTARLTGLPLSTVANDSTCLYFAAPRAPVKGNLIVLNGDGNGLVNEVVPISNVSPELAPAGSHLVSVTILGIPEADDEALCREVLGELRGWFPDAGVDGWRLLRTYRIHSAQLAQPPGFQSERPRAGELERGLTLAGEVTTNSSIDGAIESGLRAGMAVIRKVKR